MGVENLRVLAGGDGPDGVFSHIEPNLQIGPGVYNDTLLVGLDRFLAELEKRDMQAVLYLNNAWEWSGGFGQYLEWAGAGKALIPLIDGYWPFMQQMSSFSVNRKAQELYFNHLRYITSRVNSVTGEPYSRSKAIFAWQLCNEPRCFSADSSVRESFVGWLTEAAAVIRECDPNHMISTGSEGFRGCEDDIKLTEAVCSIPGIDYITIHIWPYNWGWARAEFLEEDIDAAIDSTASYISRHIAVAAATGRPMVTEEFGFPRDGFSSDRQASTRARDKYYGYVFSRVGKELAGANFWGWSGYAVPVHEFWRSGDPYSTDPSQEAQGLNGVYITDSTIDILTDKINQLELN